MKTRFFVITIIVLILLTACGAGNAVEAPREDVEIPIEEVAGEEPQPEDAEPVEGFDSSNKIPLTSKLCIPGKDGQEQCGAVLVIFSPTAELQDYINTLVDITYLKDRGTFLTVNAVFFKNAPYCEKEDGSSDYTNCDYYENHYAYFEGELGMNACRLVGDKGHIGFPSADKDGECQGYFVLIPACDNDCERQLNEMYPDFKMSKYFQYEIMAPYGIWQNRETGIKSHAYEALEKIAKDMLIIPNSTMP